MVRLISFLLVSVLVIVFLSFLSKDPIRIVSKWNMPEILQEISGIAYLDNQRFACIQDEAGTVFIYNTNTRSIEREIEFAGPGDYEGICLVGDTAWIIRSDGRMYAVMNINIQKPTVVQYPSGLLQRQEVEGICYDRSNNRLLISIKEAGRGDQTYKAIYGFDLVTKQMLAQPALQINLQDEMFRGGQKKGNVFYPSDINIHPATNEIFITDGSSAKLLIMNMNGNLIRLIQLPPKEFPQAEGICFDPKGNTFISNEGVKAPANIVEIVLE